MLAAIERLCFLPMARADFVLQLAQCQRMALNVDAITRFLLIFAPRIRQTLVSYDVDRSFMGCFTNNPTVAETLYRAGVPFWLVHYIRDVPVGTISVMEITVENSSALYVYGKEYLNVLHRNPIYTPFKTIGVYGHQVKHIEHTRTKGRMYSSLVQFKEGPQDNVSEDIKYLSIPAPSLGHLTNHNRMHVMTDSRMPRRSNRKPRDRDFSDGEQSDDIHYEYQTMQDSPTSPSPALPSRASSVAPTPFASPTRLTTDHSNLQWSLSTDHGDCTWSLTNYNDGGRWFLSNYYGCSVVVSWVPWYLPQVTHEVPQYIPELLGSYHGIESGQCTFDQGCSCPVVVTRCGHN